MDAMDIQAVESKLSDVTVTPIPMGSKPNLIQIPTFSSLQLQQQYQQQNSLSSPVSPLIITTQTSGNITTPMTSSNNIPSTLVNNSGLSKYAQLLGVLEEMGRDIRPTYTGSRSSAERLKRGIIHARILVRECLLETERSARQ